jgi:hypothetical protein
MTLNRNQKRAIKALMQSPSVAAAARRCGLTPRTLWRYLNDPEFKRELANRQDNETTALSAALAGMSSDAIQTLHDLMTDKSVSPSVRARVALGWLKERRDALELDELAQRIAALEEALNEN